MYSLYTTLSGCSLLFNGLALAALCFIRAPRTVHHRLLANLTLGDVVGTVLIWLYHNSPHIFPRFEVDRHHCPAACWYFHAYVVQLESLIGRITSVRSFACPV